MLRAGAGLVQCGQDLCDSIPMGGLARLDIGYRIGLYSIYATIDGGGGVLDLPEFDDDEGAVTNIGGGLSFLYVGAGMAVHPVDLGRVDPFVGVTLGYSRVEQRFRSDERSIDTLYSRGAVAPSMGLEVYVTNRIAIGPRFDVVLPFGGSLCQRSDGLQECVNTVDIVDSDTPAIARQRRRDFPRPWSTTLQVTFYLLGR